MAIESLFGLGAGTEGKRIWPPQQPPLSNKEREEIYVGCNERNELYQVLKVQCAALIAPYGTVR